MTQFTDEHPSGERTPLERIETTMYHLISMIVGFLIILGALYFSYLHLKGGGKVTGMWVLLQLLWFGFGSLFLIPKRFKWLLVMGKDWLVSWRKK